MRSVVNSVPEGESDGLFDGVSFTRDQDAHDIIRFKERSGIFAWLFSETIRGEKYRPFRDIMQENCTEGRKLLEIMKKKMASLPTDKSTTDEVWKNYVLLFCLPWCSTAYILAAWYVGLRIELFSLFCIAVAQV
jgi:hypothetical protein